MSNEASGRSEQALREWYDTMWAECDHTRIPVLAAPQYLRHDITGANNLMLATDYSEMVGFATAEETVAEFDYSLFAEGAYVAALGRLRFRSDRQWDWVQLFRVDDEGLLAETWLAGMGGNDIFGYPQPTTAWQGHELPQWVADTPAKRLVADYVTRVWVEADLSAVDDLIAPTLISHDGRGAQRRLTPADHRAEVSAALARGPVTVKQSFLMGAGDMVGAAYTWVFGNGVQWDLVQAFRLVDGRIAETWLPVVGGTDTSLAFGPESRWNAAVIPEPARHPKP